MDADAEARWAELTEGACPAPDDLLLLVAELLDDPAHGGTRDALDEQSRLLFAERSRMARANRLTTALRFDLGYRTDERLRPELLSLTSVVRTRVGHPLLIAVVAVALLRRAGQPATVCHAEGRWFAALSGSPLVVIDVEPGERPAAVRPVCGHLVGYTVISSLLRVLDGPRVSTLDRLLEDLPVATPAD